MEDKISKLTNTTYKLIEYFPDSDPLKKKAKEKTLSVFENQSLADIDILLGYFKLARKMGWLDGTNYLILAGEYEKLKPGAVPYKIQQLTNRQNLIVDFLDKNGQGQVMDILKVIPNVTKRTIRRDIDELLKIGQVERVGTFNTVSYRLRTNG